MLMNQVILIGITRQKKQRAGLHRAVSVFRKKLGARELVNCEDLSLLCQSPDQAGEERAAPLQTWSLMKATSEFLMNYDV